MTGAGARRAAAAWALALRRGGGGLAVAFGILAACQGHPPRPPHIVVMLIDTLRARNLGCYGYARPTSPSIDRFARDAVLFEEAISVGGNTTTAMAGLFTGHYAFFDDGVPWTWYGMERFRVRGRGVGLPKRLTTLAEHLASAGYRTAGVITNPYLKPAFSMHQGFGHYEDMFEPAELQYMMASYDTALRHVDDAVGRILRYYRDRGLFEQTVFVITSDHGEQFLEHGGTGHGGSLFDEVMHVPLVVRAPGGLSGVRVPRLEKNSTQCRPSSTTRRSLDRRRWMPGLSGHSSRDAPSSARRRPMPAFRTSA